MKKIDALLKRVELFERLAVYGDRKSFLQALSQSLPPLVVPNDPSHKPGEPGYVPGGHVLEQPAPPSYHPASLPRVIVPNEGPVGSGGHLIDPNQEVASRVDRDPNLMMSKTINAPAAPEQAAPAHQVAFNPRVKEVQSFLNQQLTQGGMGEASMPPITEDGVWGPETARALKLWGDTKGKLSGVPLQSVFVAAESQAAPSVA